MRQVVAATRNQTSVAELSRWVVGWQVVETPPGITLGVAEDGSSLASNASFADRARQLLQQAVHLPSGDRTIGWREALAVAVDGRYRASWVAGNPPGELASALHESLFDADRGFWIPAIWRCPECGGKRLADLTPSEQVTRIDHWMQLGWALTGWLGEHERETYRSLGSPSSP